MKILSHMACDQCEPGLAHPPLNSEAQVREVLALQAQLSDNDIRWHFGNTDLPCPQNLARYLPYRLTQHRDHLLKITAGAQR